MSAQQPTPLGPPASVLMTGGSGLLGRYLARELLPQVERLQLLLRHPSQKLREELTAFLTSGRKDLERRLIFVQGDICERGVVPPGRQRQRLCKEVTHLYHLAALTSLDLVDEEVLTRFNVNGTANVLAFARECRNLRKVNHLSCSAISGTAHHQHDYFYEDDVDLGQGWRNPFERTKLVAEKLAISARRDLPLTVLRPVFLIGETVTGYLPFKALIYHLFDLLAGLRTLTRRYPPLRHLAQVMPGSQDHYLDLVPVNYAATLAASIGQAYSTRGKTYCLGNSHQAMNLVEILNLLLPLFDLPVPTFFYHPGRLTALARRAKPRTILRALLDLGGVPPEAFAYLDQTLRYDASNTEEHCEQVGLKAPYLPDHLPACAEYYLRHFA